MKNPFAAIIQLLESEKVKYKLLEHEPVYTSEQAAKVRGLTLAEGAKSLLLKASREFILIVLPGDQKLDSKKVKTILSTKKLRFATPEEVVDIMGCEIGACYPLGSILGIRTFVDPKLGKNESISFNPGLHDKTIRLTWIDYKRLVQPEIFAVSAD